VCRERSNTLSSASDAPTSYYGSGSGWASTTSFYALRLDFGVTIPPNDSLGVVPSLYLLARKCVMHSKQYLKTQSMLGVTRNTFQWFGIISSLQLLTERLMN
jgi:hypothetical protein